MKSNFKPNNKKYILAISFADYTKNVSGMPKVMMAHQQVYNKALISYVSIFSVKKNILNDRFMIFCKFGLLIDGSFIGIFQMSQLIHIFYEWMQQNYKMIDIHIHHLMYINLNRIDELLSSCSNIPVKVFLHDYYLACKQYNLLKNGTVYCGGKGFAPKRCSDCLEYKKSMALEEKIHKLIGNCRDRITFISPSNITKEIFLNFHPEYKNNIVVIPHQIGEGYYMGNTGKLSSNNKIKIAFLGMPRNHKGWNVWENIVRKFSGCGYEFYVFNNDNVSYDHMRKINVAFSKEHLNAMIDALRDNKIHVAFLWSTWPETYSFTCFEAYASNTFIITNKDSGNIAYTVSRYKNGLVFAKEDDLLYVLENIDEMRKKINEFRDTTVVGPEYLKDNGEIVKMSLKTVTKGEITDSHKIINYPLLWVLNAIGG